MEQMEIPLAIIRSLTYLEHQFWTELVVQMPNGFVFASRVSGYGTKSILKKMSDFYCFILKKE